MRRAECMHDNKRSLLITHLPTQQHKSQSFSPSPRQRDTSTDTKALTPTGPAGVEVRQAETSFAAATAANANYTTLGAERLNKPSGAQCLRAGRLRPPSRPESCFPTSTVRAFIAGSNCPEGMAVRNAHTHENTHFGHVWVLFIIAMIPDICG